jgi:hypothetical protein
MGVRISRKLDLHNKKNTSGEEKITMSTATVTPTAGKAEFTRAGVTGIELPETMRALVVYGPGDYRLETVPVPRATPDDIIVKVEACGICAGDIKTYLGAESFWGGGGQQSTSKNQ